MIAITGVMAAGKSTLAQVLAERLERSAHVRGDVFRRMIVNGSAAITPEGGDAMAATLRLRYRLAAQVADMYAEAGYTAVVQDVILGPYLAEFVAQVRTRPLAVVVLAPSPTAVLRNGRPPARRPDTGAAGRPSAWTRRCVGTPLVSVCGSIRPTRAPSRRWTSSSPDCPRRWSMREHRWTKGPARASRAAFRIADGLAEAVDGAAEPRMAVQSRGRVLP